ncbi:MAG: ATP-binding cassette domain-containing protein [Acutalibacteraceae bacterium]|nr:ATP-binding cassette domain-containing protein [Acutalibacteraceae bacterium]
MNDYVVQTQNLTKKYKEHVAVNHLNMNIKKGEIYGFIGENGAGKTTTVRLLTGIAKPTSGEISIFGKVSNKDLQEARHKIGCVIEAPALFDDMTARENLEIQRIQKGIPGKSCIDDILKIVNLEDTGKKKAKNFSMGMRQRLALAIALLGNSELLLLDEPTNGLDPMGIIDMRNLLKHINQEYGITMMISSHLLEELHLIATTFGIIHKGVLIKEITANELDEKCNKYIKLTVSDPIRSVSILENELHISNILVLSNNTIQINTLNEEPERVSHAILKAGIDIDNMIVQEDTLEDYFVHVIGGNTNV